MYVVYRHTCPNGKVYIGITGISPARRWQRGKNYITNTYFYRAIQKYGWDNIKHEILAEGLSKEEASAKEIELIALYKSDQRDYGYNICSGGEINIPSESTRKRMSAAHKGKKLSEAQRKKLSEVAMGKPGTRIGKHHSEEVKKRISASQPAKVKVYQYTRYGRFVAEYESICDAARQTGIRHETIAAVMNPVNQHKSARGFIFTKEVFNITNYQEILMNVRKELMKQNISVAELKTILEDFSKSLAELYKLINAEQHKATSVLAPVAEELNKIKALLPNINMQVPLLANPKTDLLDSIVCSLTPINNDAVIEKLADEIINRLNGLNTIIINIKTEE